MSSRPKRSGEQYKFVIPTEAQRSGGTCISPTAPNRITHRSLIAMRGESIRFAKSELRNHTCHPDRSAAQRRDLHLPDPAPNQITHRSFIAMHGITWLATLYFAEFGS